jgi:hypothetical protein
MYFSLDIWSHRQGQNDGMDIVEALLHGLNFLWPAAGTALIAASAVKVLWRRDLRHVAWWRLAAWAVLAGALVSVAGLVVFGEDGRMATYGLLVLAETAALGWVMHRGRQTHLGQRGQTGSPPRPARRSAAAGGRPAQRAKPAQQDHPAPSSTRTKA